LVLVPSYVAVDGLVVPLAIHQDDGRFPTGLWVATDPRRPDLDYLMYIVNAMLGRPRAMPWLDLLRQRQPVQLFGVGLRPLEPEDLEESPDYVERWTRLTGRPPDVDDAYVSSTMFLSGGMVVPRTTLIKLVEKLIELDDAIADGRLEAKIDRSMEIPPPPPPPPPSTPPMWADAEWEDLDRRLKELDELDPLVPESPALEQAQRAARLRGSIFSLLDVAWRRTLLGDDDLPGRVAELELANLQAVCDASDRLLAYVHDPERRAIVKTEPPDSPFMADVSIDLFRLPPAPHPDGYRRHEWLAYCEAIFVEQRGPVENVAGDIFTRIDGLLVRLRYRAEAGAHLYLWRVELL